VPVRSALEMEHNVLARFGQTDVLLMAAAVSDYRPVLSEIRKIKRVKVEMQFYLTQNPDILKSLSALKGRQVVVGFAAETHDLESEARRKLTEKNLDFIVANDVNRPDSGFQADTNEVSIIGREGEPESLPLQSKEEVAEKILDRVAELLAAREREKA
jgi:phosphopantothenoylcysteine decarboxylase/phosphopantothenate--cysteine ligase